MFPWEIESINVLSNANNFHCPAMQYGCPAKPIVGPASSVMRSKAQSVLIHKNEL